MRIYIFYLVLIFNVLNCFSQKSTQIADLIPPSPNVRNFLKYGDIPVSNYTGVPNINIPIHTIQLKDISLPIDISYNASGIKVEEEASRIGLGWVLNGGGLISVTVMGPHHDFTNVAYFNNGVDNKLNDITGIDNLTEYNISGPKFSTPFDLAAMNMDKTILFTTLTSNSYQMCGGVEVAPDIYNYSFNGYSGKFIFSHSGKIIKEKEDNVLIIPIKKKNATGINILESWKTITPDGTIYYFETTEKTTFTDRPKAENYNSCYYLSKIETINGSIINLNYKKEKPFLGRFFRSQDNTSIGTYLVSNYAYYETVYLDNISYPGGKIRFEYKYDREDFQPEPRLTCIYIDNESGENKSKWIFEHEYFTSNKFNVDRPTLQDLNKRLTNNIYYNNAFNNSFYNDSWNKKRLKLKKIINYDSSMSGEIYQFSYNELNLPTKLSTAMDHWGYYNGALNGDLIPGFLQNISQTPNTIDVKHKGGTANRSPDSIYNQAFILKEIIYPTGGKSQFTFESNTYDAGNFENDPSKKDYMYEGYGGTQKVSLIQGVGLNNAPVDWVQTEMLNCPEKANPSWKAKINIKVKITLDDSYNNRPSGPEKKFEISVVSKDKKKIPWSYTCQIPDIPSSITSSNRTIQKFWNDIETDFDNYEIRAVGTLRTYIREAEITVERIVASPSYIPLIKKDELGGGIRICKIQNIDITGEPVYTKEYKYVKGNPTYKDISNGETSGKLMFYPRYNKNWRTVGTDGLRGSGYSVGYSSVHIIDFNNKDEQIGRTLYEYINKPDLVLNYSWKEIQLPNEPKPLESKDENPIGIGGYKYSENGTLLKKTIMKLKNNRYEKEQEIEYKYLGKGGGPYIIWGIWKQPTVDLERSPSPGCFEESTVDRVNDILGVDAFHYLYGIIPWGYLYPAIIPMQYCINQKIETNICDDGSEIKTITDYSYNSKYQIIKEVIKSNDILKTIEYKYPPDIISNTIVNKLSEANRINIPIEIKHTINEQTFETVNSYALFHNIPQLSTIKTNTTTNRDLETRIIYKEYDTYGNPQSIIQDDAIQTVYLWSYKGQYPIAEIKNATTTEVNSALSAVGLLSIDALSTNPNPDKTKLDKLRTLAALDKALITTYTYQPLVGILESTDPSSITTYYEYDNFNRLKRTYIKEGTVERTIQNYNYNYINK